MFASRRRERVPLNQRRNCQVGLSFWSHTLRCRKKDPQLSGFVFFLRLLPSERYLSGHNALSFSNEGAFRTSTIAPSTVALMSLQCTDHTVIPASCTFRRPLVTFAGAKEECWRYSAQHRMLGHQRWHIDTVSRNTHINILRREKQSKMITRIFSLEIVT